MQKLAEVCIRRPVFAAMIVLSLVVVGATSWFRLGVDRFPAVDLPTVTIRTELPGASTEEVEIQISRRIEEAVNAVEGTEELRSISAQGRSVVIVTFDLRRDIDTAAQDVRDRVAGILNKLPREAKPPVISKFNNESTPVLTVALGGSRSIRELTELADKVVKPKLERSHGVGDVQIVGGLERAISVWVDAHQLAAYQIPITTVREALVRQNADVPGGNVTGPEREHSLRTMGRLTDAPAFNDLVVATVKGVPIRIRDIGRAEDGTKEQRSLARLNGRPGVVLEVRRQSGANTVAVIEGVKSSLARLETELPPDVRPEVIQDQSRYIYTALHEINVHLVLGSILVSLVVLTFMRSWRSTLIAAVAIPTSLISTFGMMWALDFTLNSVTMLALVLMVGVVIDDAIVVLENIFRFVEEKRMRPFEAARAATAEIGLAVMATTFSLVVIFVPVSFISSISGRFLYQFGLTAGVAVLVSLLVSFTLTPMMSARLLRAEATPGTAASRTGFYAWLDRGYAESLAFAMRHRVLVAVLSLVVAAASVPLYLVIGKDYLPSGVDEGEFEVQVTAPQGTSVGAMESAVSAVETEVRETRGVRLVLTTIGSTFLGAVNEARMYVRLAPHEERVFSVSRLVLGLLHGDPLAAFRGNYSQQEVMQDVRQRLRKFRGDLRVAVRNPRGFMFVGGFIDIDFVLRGPDLAVLAAHADRLRARSEALGLMDADTTLKLDKPELRVRIDRARAADLGVDTEHVASALRLMVGGDDEVSRFYDPTVNDEYDVLLRLRPQDRDDPAAIPRLHVPRTGGGLVRLDNLVTVEPAQGASRIDRLDRQREARLRANVAPGYALADRVEALGAEVVRMALPAGYTTSVAGRARELERTFGEFVWAFALAVVFMYMILAAQFESLVHPLTILLSLPLSVPFALLSLWLTGKTLNLYSALGVLVLFGVVKKNAILQIDHTNQLRAAGMNRSAAILQANRDRLRPILMTTLTFVAGMIPLALGTGPGAEERRAIAVVIIGGQTLCLLLTLIATPVAYSFLDDVRILRRRRVPVTGPVTAAPLPESGVAVRGPARSHASDGPVHAPSPASAEPLDESAPREGLPS
ncbi:MAG: efflux RND transporter permease subunit [Candidatus Rokubacteria bacterium]|nr:efflux RND transporter permease subunit [Candidatus Rokubacteria bacterium]